MKNNKIHDFIFSVGSIVFIIALIPMLFSSHKPPFITAAPTAIVLLIFFNTYINMKFYYTASITFITFIFWAVITCQTI